MSYKALGKGWVSTLVHLPLSFQIRARIVASSIQAAGGTIYRLSAHGDWKRQEQGRWKTLGLFQKAIALYLDYMTTSDIDNLFKDMREYRESCFRDGDNLYPERKARCPICHKNGDSALIARNTSVMMESARSATSNGTEEREEEEEVDPLTPPPHTRPQR